MVLSWFPYDSYPGSWSYPNFFSCIKYYILRILDNIFNIFIFSSPASILFPVLILSCYPRSSVYCFRSLSYSILFPILVLLFPVLILCCFLTLFLPNLVSYLVSMVSRCLSLLYLVSCLCSVPFPIPFLSSCHLSSFSVVVPSLFFILTLLLVSGEAGIFCSGSSHSSSCCTATENKMAPFYTCSA